MNIVSQSAAVLLLGVVTVAGCVDRPTGPVPARQVAADFAIDAVSIPMCDVDGATWKGDADAAVLNDVAPSGSLRVGINYGNTNNATRNPVTGQLSGVAVGMCCGPPRRADQPPTLGGYAGGSPLLPRRTTRAVDLAFTPAPA